jgi:hypothetical protein
VAEVDPTKHAAGELGAAVMKLIDSSVVQPLAIQIQKILPQKRIKEFPYEEV